MRRTIAVAILFVAASWVPGATQPVDIELQPGLGTVIRLDRSFQNGTIHVGDPAIADVKPAQASDRVLLLNAAKVGRTSLFVLDNKGEEIYRAVVNVTIPAPAVSRGGVQVHSLPDGRSRQTGAGQGTTNIHGYTEYVCNPVCSLMGTVDPKDLKPARPDLKEGWIDRGDGDRGDGARAPR